MLDARTLLTLLPVGLLAPAVAAPQNLAWTESVTSTEVDELADLIADDEGGVFSCGSTQGAVAGGAPPAGWGGWVARHDAQGQLLWTLALNQPDTRLVGAVTDSLGGVMVAGSTRGAYANSNLGGWDAFMIRYLPTGSTNGTWLYGTAQDDVITATGSGGGRIALVAGRSTLPNTDIVTNVWIGRHDLTSQLGFWNFGPVEFSSIKEITATGDGGAYVVGIPVAPGQPQLLRRYDPDFQRLWTVPMGPGLSVEDIEPDGQGGLFLIGTRSGVAGPNGPHGQVHLARYDSTGTRSWFTEFGTDRDDQGRSLSVDGDGDLLLAGTTAGDIAGTGNPAQNEDPWAAKYSADGAEIWTRQVTSAGTDFATGVATDGGGGLLLGGATFGDLAGPNQGSTDAWVARFTRGLEFRTYCLAPAVNSTGSAGRMDATGDNIVAENSLTLAARQLPPNTFAIFVTSQTQGFVAFPGGSQGYLCLGGAIGRFIAPGQILNAGAAGAVSLAVDLTAIPTPSALVAAAAGETWHFQGWYRDLNPMATSNYTDAISVELR